MRFLFKYPSRSRPEMFAQTFLKWYSMLSKKHEYTFLITLDIDDETMNTPRIQEVLNKPSVILKYGEHKSKVEAINADIDSVDGFDILVLVSDDMIPQVNGYDDIIASNMVKHFPDYSGCLHFNDGRVGRRLNTLSILGKKLYDQLGYIYHPDYISLWCDNEFQQVTESMNKSVYIDTVIVKHDWESLHRDPLNSRNEAFYFRDKAIFDARKNAGFPKERIGHTVDVSNIELRPPTIPKPRLKAVRRDIKPSIRRRKL